MGGECTYTVSGMVEECTYTVSAMGGECTYTVSGMGGECTYTVSGMGGEYTYTVLTVQNLHVKNVQNSYVYIHSSVALTKTSLLCYLISIKPDFTFALLNSPTL
jgi:hypothetical protein